MHGGVADGFYYHTKQKKLELEVRKSRKIYIVSDFGSSSKRLPHEVGGLWHRHIKISPCYFTSSEYQKSFEKPSTYLIENQI